MENKLNLPLKKKKNEAESPRLDPLMRALKALHSAGAPETMTEEELEHQRRSQEVLGRLTAPMAGMDYEEFSLGGMNAAWMRLKAPHGSRHAILYCHGGGYTSGNLGYARVLASKLAHVTGYDVLSFEYRLAPEHPYPAAVEDALRAWDHLMLLGYGARDIVLAGDSAGGNLALVLCHRLKAAGRRLPGALVLMSPWTDMTMSGGPTPSARRATRCSRRSTSRPCAPLTPAGGTTPRPISRRSLPTLPASRRRSFRPAITRSCIRMPRCSVTRWSVRAFPAASR